MDTNWRMERTPDLGPRPATAYCLFLTEVHCSGKHIFADLLQHQQLKIGIAYIKTSWVRIKANSEYTLHSTHFSSNAIIFTLTQAPYSWNSALGRLVQGESVYSIQYTVNNFNFSSCANFQVLQLKLPVMEHLNKISSYVYWS